MTAISLFLALLGAPRDDLRAAYDVDTYRLDLRVYPESSSLRGTVGISAKVLKPITTFELDLMEGRKVTGVAWVEPPIGQESSLVGEALAFVHEGSRIRVTLPRRLAVGQEARIAVSYEVNADQIPGRGGIRFGKTPDGKPWITTSCQTLGGHSWWPQKGENEHPEDKFAHLMMNVTVPDGLTAVCNGKLVGRKAISNNVSGALHTFQWRHDYPCENYAVTLDVAPYVELKGTLNLKGIAKPVPYSYYVLPQDVEKAKLQFEEVPRMLEIYGEAFGPYPFPNSKFGLVQTDFWGMEHSTAVAYGNSFPAWIKKHGGEDRWADRNKYFDYILILEVAHEWWGNAVSARDWGHLWLHEGFATYTEGVYVEKMMGREKADEYFATLRPRVLDQFREFRGTGSLPSQAFNNNVYYKGALILNTLRHYVDDDAAWWKALRTFNMRFRYKNAVTEDFQKVLEEVTRKPWKAFFDQWFYGDGYPKLRGSVRLDSARILVEVENPRVRETGFDVPLDLAWEEGRRGISRRVMLRPGANRIEIQAPNSRSLRIVNLHRILGDHQVEVR